jgi:hypothetical protein
MAQNSIRFVLDLLPVWSATVSGLQANLVHRASRLQGHRNRTDLGAFPIKAGSSNHAIQPPFSTKFPLHPIEFEELGFCNSL